MTAILIVLIGVGLYLVTKNATVKAKLSSGASSVKKFLADTWENL